MEDLNNKDFKPISLVDKAINNQKILEKLLEGLTSKNHTYRNNSFQVVFLISEKEPEVLYPQWDFFFNFLKSRNNFHKVIAIKLLANLIKIDTENKFKAIFNDYIEQLRSESIMTARTLVQNLGKIANSNPDLIKKITEVLFSVEKQREHFQHKELIKADVINTFSEIFDLIEDKHKVVNYIKAQIKSESPKTRKSAQLFLKRYG